MSQTLAPSVVTTRDPQGLKFVSIVEAAYNKARLMGEEAQRVNDTPGLAELIGNFIAESRLTDKYANEEVRSKYVYPPEFKGPRPIEDQIVSLAAKFGLDPRSALEYAANLLDLKGFVPEDALSYVSWFAFPRAITREAVLAKIAESRSFYNYRASEMDRFRLHTRTSAAIETLAAAQGNGDILVVAAQLGMRHRGRSTRRARECFARNEFGLDTVAGGAIALTHPTRFVRWEELDMDLPGDEFDEAGSDDRFGRAACLVFDDDRLEFGTERFDDASESFGSASAFLPQ